MRDTHPSSETGTEGRTRPLFFSVIIPAYNEERYIAKTLTHLSREDYPQECLEVIIVENGSSDRTREVVEETALPHWRILHVAQHGVSRAKNAGIAACAPQADWVIFLDADTYPLPGFLRELNEFLLSHRTDNPACGMVRLRPWPETPKARAWYAFYNFANRVTRTTRSIQIVRRDILREVRFDEALAFGEDTRLLAACKKRGRYFYLPTDQVFSSTRRFEKRGWVRQLFTWIYLHFLPYELKKRASYPALR
ncbi:glycosyltransferase family 2 protein [Spirochaeta thermophila]|uniref:Putative minor teichoic acid biosynthesis protein GgaA n=1 Tax=Winmispira thermophila (strain ATCC 49972 / DSM 6192 / RI 19.B1) TaxID=665571 RepID=E0RTQ2_WINT6|nr:glycosyltransferase family 2 protein [Spirochaeta thermophila]ADN02427.1 putative minor teichoic acid biosynthesis protein GgaA [Spirochaeta thermophila DSM 6192]